MKYRSFLLLIVIMFLFPSCIGRPENDDNSARYEAYLNHERFLLPGGKELLQNFHYGISRYGEVIRKESQKCILDWRLIAALMFMESSFNSRAGSVAGAAGLMQLMPATARSFGIKNVYDPVQNIRGGICQINWIDDQFVKEIPDTEERLKFVLASYNAGLSHLKDAQRLAEKYGKNPRIWENNVDYFVLNMSQKQYYSDKEVRSGYYNGKETYEFVKSVLACYNDFIAFVPY
jgi:membrane-bound lytic murein transglycosylase F